METRELYKQKYQAQIREWSAQLDVMKAQSEKLAAQAKLDAKPHLDAVHAKFEAAKAGLKDVVEATDDKWDGVVKDVTRGWAELKAAAEGAYAALKGDDEGKAGEKT
jgi:hypothetical protein